MTALENGFLWFAMFAVPMMIAVVLRRLGRRYGLDDRSTPGDPAQEPDYRRWGGVAEQAGGPSRVARRAAASGSVDRGPASGQDERTQQPAHQ
jgi:hypothetical protein